MIESATIATMLVPSPAEYRMLVPPAHPTPSEPYPLLLCLHGGLGGDDFLGLLAPIILDMWETGALPPMVVAAPLTGRSFYLDYHDGSESWETFLLTDFLAHIRNCYRVSSAQSRTFVSGISMGGAGALRLALKRPDMFGAVVAWEANVEPAYQWKDVGFEDRFWRPRELMEARFGRPLDEAYWANNNPAMIARTRAAALRRSELRIYLEVGTDDAYGLYRGAEFLHRTLYDHGVKHEYRCVLGADHIGPSLPSRLRDGLAFLARCLAPAVTDERVARLRELVSRQKHRAEFEENAARAAISADLERKAGHGE
jgi:S-formylglutathione hydrolase